MDFHYTHPHASARLPVFARNVVATSHPLAAQAGLAMLQRGGNAVDAAIATAAVMSILEPCSNGLGSDAFCILWDGTRLHGLNASGGAPAAWTPEYFRRRHGEQPAPPRRGWDSVTVPGAVAAWAALSERFGRLPFADLLARAIEIAERGSAVPVVIQGKWQLASQVHDLASQPGFEQVFLPHGRAPRVGERFAMPGAARALRAIAADARRSLLPRRDRAGDRAACARARRRDDGRRPRRIPAGMGRAALAGLPQRLPAARDPAERPGHRGADRAGHPAPLRPRDARPSTAPSASTCSSRR